MYATTNISKVVILTARLEEVRKAISVILVGGQSYQLGRRSLTRANLSELLALEKQLEDDIDAARNPQGRFRRVVPRDY